ncbi:MAG TPA: hypothetical protein VE754_03995 [Actinomycetota bacterium]|nr:hypothetical protein [Actinomycetota bacterium]
MRVERGLSPMVVAAAIGAAWGAIGYLVLWGYIAPLFPSRRFVVGAVGTTLFLPVKTVLLAIRGLESLAGRSFELASNHAWIGLAAAATGAAMAVAGYLVVRVVRKRFSPAYS